MASNITSFVVLGPNGRRHTVKVSPNTSILQLLEEACRKHSINPNDYELKHCNKSLDLSLSVRFANLPNNAMLELHPTKGLRQEGIVTVGLQLESGDRITGNFTPSTTVWDVVTSCLNTSCEDDTENQPSCVYMRQTISGDAMKQTTLRSLGLTGGKAIFRIIYRQPFELQQQAHVSTPLKKTVREQDIIENKEKPINLGDPCCSVKKQARLDLSYAGERHIDSESKSSHHSSDYDTSENVVCSKPDVEKSFNVKSQDTLPTSVNITCITKDELNQSMVCDSNRQTNSDDLMEVDNSSESNLPIEEKGTVKILGERSAMLFNLEDITVLPRTELPDDFFDLTIQDMQYLMGEYKKVRMDLENKPLELTTQKENRELQQLALYTQCVIRIYFPNRLVLQGIFSVGETVHSVMEFVRSFLENKELNFYLYTAPPKVKLSAEKTLLECRLLSAAVVHFGCDKYLNNYLLPHIKDQVSDPGAAFKAAAESRRHNKSFSTINTTNEDVDLDNDTNVSLPPTTSNSDDSRTKVPKWLQFNKK